jgi:predicted SnoaL-like aldol condensation-catalyzing enzyme
MTKKEIALSFLSLAAKGNAKEAFTQFASPTLIHHNAYFPADPVVLMEAMEESARMNPNKIFQVQRALEDGDVVAVHSFIKQYPEDRGAVVIHIFRFENEKIAELWDFGQMMPEEIINSNGML